MLSSGRRVSKGNAPPWPGHAYLIDHGPPRSVVGDGVLLVGGRRWPRLPAERRRHRPRHRVRPPRRGDGPGRRRPLRAAAPRASIVALSIPAWVRARHTTRRQPRARPAPLPAGRGAAGQRGAEPIPLRGPFLPAPAAATARAAGLVPGRVLKTSLEQCACAPQADAPAASGT